jgi:hypothetical protein
MSVMREVIAAVNAAGLDMQQAFQPLAGNDFAAAYAMYGEKLTFITGIDTQRGESMGPQEFQDDIINNVRRGSG